MPPNIPNVVAAPTPFAVNGGADPMAGLLALMRQLIQGQSEMTTAINNLTTQVGTSFPQWVAVPATATSSGVAGQVAYEAGFFYVCVSSNVWRRVAIAVF